MHNNMNIKSSDEINKHNIKADSLTFGKLCDLTKDYFSNKKIKIYI